MPRLAHLGPRAVPASVNAPPNHGLAPALQQIDRTYVLHKSRKLSYFGGCDYFRLSSHPAVLQALHEGLERYGLNVAASRKTTGNHALYERLEKRLARFFHAETATLVPSGYVSNWIAAQTLVGKFSHVLIDANAHSSLVSAAALVGGKVVTFPHCNAAGLAKALQDCGRSARPLVLTDGLFAHDGTVAPLPEYLAVLPKRGLLLVDDAHGAGTLGTRGRGTLEYTGASGARIVQTLTLSKAFGVYGGVILGPRTFQQEIFRRSSLFAGQTPLPLPLANAALAALDLLASDADLRVRLEANTAFVKSCLRAAGLDVPDNASPIIRVVPKDCRQAEWLQKRLLRQGIFPSLICYRGAGESAYFRFAISSEHTHQQLEGLVLALV